ncbi:hypothetical protein LR48_Vigan04g191600 [Vigna angularis]|uniref:Uncharacterized protein n=1 Tax=Phaseolus angularis TaxID=3914 RepID=A0A0L9UG44_PHAAN|nr:hypothetical protein LR48_Vigan04g191600 [Vigna angularis]
MVERPYIKELHNTTHLKEILTERFTKLIPNGQSNQKGSASSSSSSPSAYIHKDDHCNDKDGRTKQDNTGLKLSSPKYDSFYPQRSTTLRTKIKQQTKIVQNNTRNIMQPELGLHVHKNEQLGTRNLPVSEPEIVRFKLKLGTSGVLLRDLNGDRKRGRRPCRGVLDAFLMRFICNHGAPAQHVPMSTLEAEAEPSSNHIHSLPLVDLRLLSQPELYTLSLSGATHRHQRASDNDPVIPKIDRSNFNESAGSRKQTFSKLRLNKRKQNSAALASSSYHIPEPVDRENSQIISLLQQLFGVEPLRNELRPNSGDAADRQLFPVHVEFKQPPPLPVAFQNVPIDVIDASNRKRKRGRPRKNENLVTVFEEETKKVNEEGSTVVRVNERGFGMDADGLDYDPFGEELKRRTEGLETERQLLEFLETLNGEWASQRKKRRIVSASDLSDLLPAGWKIVITLLRRAGRASVVCRRYVRTMLSYFVWLLVIEHA